MLPSMPLISAPCKDIQNISKTGPDEYSQVEASVSNPILNQLASPLSRDSEVFSLPQSGSGMEICPESENQSNISGNALDLSVTTNIPSKKLSPLKHVTPILKKYNSHRKGKGNKKVPLRGKSIFADQSSFPQGSEKQGLRPIAPKPVMVVLKPAQQLQHEEDTHSDNKDMSEDSVQATGSMNQEMVKKTEIVNGTADVSEAKMAVSEEEEKHHPSVEHKDSEDELAALMLASTTIRSKGLSQHMIRKKSKQMKDMQSTLALLTPEAPAVREEKSYGFAQAYFVKVKERLEGTELYHEFLHAMNEFGLSIVNVSDLYQKVTSVLSEHPDLCEEFLAFLLPEQALQCGKFMEYLVITKMKDFFRKLQIYYEKQPQQMNKIYTSLSLLSNQHDVTVADVRSAILPLLKGNSLLRDNFLALLPQERPPESMMTEFEEMDFGEVDSENLGDKDLVETLVVPTQPDSYGGDRCACVCHNSRDDRYHVRAAHCISCGTRFIHGKVFLQTGKVLRPAKVVFEGENSDDTINRLSVKNIPKVRNRKKATVHADVPSTSKDKDSSPAKQVPAIPSTEDANENGVDNLLSKTGVKSSSPKCNRSSKTKVSGTVHKTREKTSTAKGSNLSKSLAFEGKDLTRKGIVKEQKQSSPTNPTKITRAKKRPASPDSLVSATSTSISITTTAVVSMDNSDKVVNSPTSTTDVVVSISLPSGPADEKDMFSQETNTVQHGEKNDADSIFSADTMDEDSSEIFLLDTQEKCDSIKCDVSENVTRVVPVSEECVDAGVNDVVMSETEEGIADKTQEMSEPNVQTNQDEKCNNDTVPSSWTREEDKILLQMFQLEGSEEQTFIKISEQLSHRSLDEIKSRFQILMHLLQQMTGAKIDVNNT